MRYSINIVHVTANLKTNNCIKSGKKNCMKYHHNDNDDEEPRLVVLSNFKIQDITHNSVYSNACIQIHNAIIYYRMYLPSFIIYKISDLRHF